MALLFGTVSCNVLDTPSTSSFEEESIYSSYALAERAIFGISEVFAENNSYVNRFLCWYGFNTDIEWYTDYKPTTNKDKIALYDVLPTNSELNTTPENMYSLLYRGVERANLAINGLKQYGNLDTDADMRYLLGEALTLRAFIYYELTKAWGDVPARFEPITSETIYIPKSCRNVIYKQILSDLDEAIPYLPYPDNSTRTDNINKVFAEGLYARIALAASGYALRPGMGGGDDAADVNTGALGTVRLSSDPDLAKSVLYPKALAYLEDAIRSGSCSLDPSLEAYWKRQSAKENINFDGETLYVIPFGDQRGRWNYTYAIRSDGSSYTSGESRGGQVGPLPNFYFKFDANDVRRDLTCVNWKFDNKDVPVTAGIAKWYFGKYRYDWMGGGKGYDGTINDGVKPVMMRYSDILLMAAEIANELGNLSDAKNYLLQVRKRAFTGHEDEAEAYVSAIAGKEDMFEAIVDERAFEFCGEFLRKGDLIRWNRLKTNMDEAIADLHKLRNLEGEYAYLSGSVYTRVAADKKSLLFYGFNPGEDQDMEALGWKLNEDYITKVKDSSGKDTGLYDDRINGLYTNNPDEYMFWPILDQTLSTSQGFVVNDYAYASN